MSRFWMLGQRLCLAFSLGRLARTLMWAPWLSLAIAAPAGAEVKVPIPDASLSAIATQYFPLVVQPSEEPYTLSSPAIRNRSDGRVALDVEVTHAESTVAIGRLTISGKPSFESPSKRLTFSDLVVDRLEPKPDFVNTALLAKAEMVDWLGMFKNRVSLPVPEHPMLSNALFELTDISTETGALILEFQ